MENCTASAGPPRSKHTHGVHGARRGALVAGVEHLVQEAHEHHGGVARAVLQEGPARRLLCGVFKGALAVYGIPEY